MRILYMCTVPGFQIANDVFRFERLGHEVIVLNVWKNEWNSSETNAEFKRILDLYYPPHSSKLASRFHRHFFPYSKILATHIATVQNSIARIVREEDIGVIYSSWDSGALMDATGTKRAMRRHGCKGSVIFRFLMYPASLYRITIALENVTTRQTIPGIDGRIWATEAMYKYAIRKFGLLSDKKDFVFPFLPSEHYYPQRRRYRISHGDGEPHLIFIGATDFGTPIRNAKSQIIEIAGRGIHLHMMRSTDSSKLSSLGENSRYLHFFDPIPMEHLTEFMTAFDGSLITCNYSKRLNGDRFRNGLPNRLFWSIASGIPIFLFAPPGKMDGCERFATENNIGTRVSNAKDLMRMLSDDDWMRALETSALGAPQELTYDNHALRLQEFVLELAEGR